MFFLFMALTLCGDGNMGTPITFSSANHDILWYSTWHLTNRFFGDGAILVINGSAKDNEGLEIYRWYPNNNEKVFTTTPREGIFNARNVAVTPNGETIFLGDYVPGLIYQFSNDGGFKRLAQKEDTEALFYYQGALIRVARLPDPSFEVVMGQEPESLKEINAHLPKDTERSSGNIANEDQTLISIIDHSLAVGYKLYNKIAVFDMESGDILQSIEFNKPFPGYLSPPLVFDGKVEINDIKSFTLKRERWLESFHRLEKIAWYRGRLYGLFFRGLEDFGIWASLDNKGDSYSWDNNQQEIKLLCVGPDRVILGKVDEQQNEELEWTLWQNASLPSR